MCGGVDLVGLETAVIDRLHLSLSRRRLKNSFFCAVVVPIFTSDQLCRTYSLIAAMIITSRKWRPEKLKTLLDAIGNYDPPEQT